MNWHAAVAILAAGVQIAAIIPYIRDMLRGATRPNLVSWGLWELALVITVAAQWSAGASWSIFLPLAALFANSTVLFFGSIGYGYKKFSATDATCLFFALAAIVLWIVTNEPILALVFAIAADGIAYIPTFRKTYVEPHSETPFLWLALAVVGILSATSTTLYNVANLAFPIYYALINTALWALVFFGQRLKPAPMVSQ